MFQGLGRYKSLPSPEMSKIMPKCPFLRLFCTFSNLVLLLASCHRHFRASPLYYVISLPSSPICDLSNSLGPLLCLGESFPKCPFFGIGGLYLLTRTFSLGTLRIRSILHTRAVAMKQEGPLSDSFFMRDWLPTLVYQHYPSSPFSV